MLIWGKPRAFSVGHHKRRESYWNVWCKASWSMITIGHVDISNWVIGRVICGRPIWNYEPDYPELYDTKSYYQLIVPITKCKNLSLGIFINVRNRFQSKKMTGFNFGCGSPTAWRSFFQKSIFLIKIHVCQYLNKMGEFLKVMELKYSLSRQL